MFSFTSRKSASLRAARCSQRDDIRPRPTLTRAELGAKPFTKPRRWHTRFNRGGRAMDDRSANDRITSKAEQLRFVSRVLLLSQCREPARRACVMSDLDV